MTPPSVVLLTGCNRRSGEPTDRVVGALGGSLTISGTITDANGLPLPGVTVHLDGTSQAVQVETTGAYSFPGLRARSYAVRPTLVGCTFVPDVVNLNNLTASRTQDFGGSGASCGGAPMRSEPGSVGLGVAHIPLNRGFKKVRIAVNAVQNGITQAIATVGQIL